jgi:SNF2 family DNA or RNA helicase
MLQKAAFTDIVEGHKVKNPNMKLAEALRGIPAKLKVIISGTPIQV